MKIRQLFCKHIWKIDKQEFLYSTVNYNSFVYDIIGSRAYRSAYNYYAIYYVCVKCDKPKILEERFPVEIKK